MTINHRSLRSATGALAWVIALAAAALGTVLLVQAVDDGDGKGHAPPDATHSPQQLPTQSVADTLTELGDTTSGASLLDVLLNGSAAEIVAATSTEQTVCVKGSEKTGALCQGEDVKPGEQATVETIRSGMLASSVQRTSDVREWLNRLLVDNDREVVLVGRTGDTVVLAIETGEVRDLVDDSEDRERWGGVFVVANLGNARPIARIEFLRPASAGYDALQFFRDGEGGAWDVQLLAVAPHLAAAERERLAAGQRPVDPASEAPPTVE